MMFRRFSARRPARPNAVRSRIAQCGSTKETRVVLALFPHVDANMFMARSAEIRTRDDATRCSARWKARCDDGESRQARLGRCQALTQWRTTPPAAVEVKATSPTNPMVRTNSEREEARKT